jgi:membrane-bound lytic murein transglycosylase A
LYFGAGADAGKVSGRLRHNMHFLMLVPKSIDPAARARRMPLPDPRPSEAIAKLLDQEKAEKEKAEKEKAEKEKAEKEKLTPADAMTTGPVGAANTTKAANDATSKPVEAAAPVAQPSATPTTTAPVPIPEPRPNIATGAEARRSLHHHPYRLSR